MHNESRFSQSESISVPRERAHKQTNHIASTLISHNIMINGHRTSVRLEKEMWIGIKDIARLERCSVHMLCSEIAQRKRPGTSLTAAIRVFIMCYFQAAATTEGHQQAGHGMGAHHATHVLQKQDNVPYYGLREFKQLPHTNGMATATPITRKLM